MVRRINELSEEQRATFPEWRDRWLAKGLQVGPLTTDEWSLVDAAAREVAAFSNLPTPLIIHARSPLAGAIAAPVALQVAAAGVGAGVWAGVGAGVEAGVGAGVRAGVGAGVEAGVRAGVRDGVRDGVREILADYPEELHQPILVGLRRAQSEWVPAWRGGNLWAGDYAWVGWFRTVGDLELDGDSWARYDADLRLATAGPQAWYRAGDHCVVAISDRPVQITRDPLGRSHSETGPAAVWADGWQFHTWHGVAVPPDFYGWDVTRALAEKNTEVRRCAIERLGWDAVTNQMRLVATADDPGNPGQVLALYDLGSLRGLYDADARILLVSNASLDKGGHRRRFGLPVPGHHTDPVAAAAELFNVPLSTYQQLNRAC